MSVLYECDDPVLVDRLQNLSYFPTEGLEKIMEIFIEISLPTSYPLLSYVSLQFLLDIL